MLSNCNRSKNKVNISIDTATNGNKISQSAQKDVSLINLIATPEKYNGRQIRIIGYLNLEFEGNGIYLHKDDYDNGISKNGLWVEMSMDSTRLPEIKKSIKKYVLMEGTFDLSGGHMGAYSGSIKDITRLEIWRSVTPQPPTKHATVRFSKPIVR
jgi:hypothetical protein